MKIKRCKRGERKDEAGTRDTRESEREKDEVEGCSRRKYPS